MTSAARLKASLWRRIAPSTDRSASRLCGSVRWATAASGIPVGAGPGMSVDQKLESLKREVSPRRTRRTGEILLPSGVDLRVLRVLRGKSLRSVLLLPFGNHPNLDVGRDVAVQLDGHGVLAHFLDRVVQLQFPPIAVEALPVQRFRHRGARRRS